MKVKAKNVSPAKIISWDPGNYTVLIKNMQLARTKYGQPIMTKNQEPKIEVIFKCINTKKEISYFFFDTEKSKWIIKKLCKAVGIPETKTIDVSLFVKKPVVISVRHCKYSEDGETVLHDSLGNEIITVEVFDFMNVEGAPSQLEEDKFIFYRSAAELKWNQ